MTSADVLNNIGAVCSILGAGVLSCVGGAFAAGRWWGGRRLNADAMQEALSTACAALEAIKLEAARASGGEIFTRGDKISLEYSVTSTCDIPKGLWLGASIWDEHGKWANSNVIEDQAVAIRKGSHAYHRTLTPGTDWKTRGLRVEGGSMVRHPRARERSVLDAEREAYHQKGADYLSKLICPILLSLLPALLAESEAQVAAANQHGSANLKTRVDTAWPQRQPPK
jgi:hypothetical protein